MGDCVPVEGTESEGGAVLRVPNVSAHAVSGALVPIEWVATKEHCSATFLLRV